jgi:hypothetical protein
MRINGRDFMNANTKTVILLVLLMVGLALVGRFIDQARTEPDLGLCPFCGAPAR